MSLITHFSLFWTWQHPHDFVASLRSLGFLILTINKYAKVWMLVPWFVGHSLNFVIFCESNRASGPDDSPYQLGEPGEGCGAHDEISASWRAGKRAASQYVLTERPVAASPRHNSVLLRLQQLARRECVRRDEGVEQGNVPCRARYVIAARTHIDR